MKKFFYLSVLILFTLKAVAQTGASSTESPISYKNLSGSVSGTLAMPQNASGKVPLVLIIADSGPTDRNGNNPQADINDNAYKLIAEALAKNGIASVRYDKRMVGESKTSNKPADARYDDYVDDAVGLIEMLGDDQRFSKVIVLGHGEGSMVGMLAAHDQPVKAIISVNATSQPGDKFLMSQLKSKPQYMQDAFKTLIDSLRKGKTTDNVDPSLYYIASPAKQKFVMSYCRYAPVQTVKAVKVPLLIIQGSTDVQISVADAEKLKKAKSEAILTIIPGMNHIMKEAPADTEQNLATYSKPELPLKTEFVTAVVNFVNKVN